MGFFYLSHSLAKLYTFLDSLGSHFPRPASMSYRLALHIFRRDLRLHDNTALIYAQTHAQKTLPCFIFDPRQVKENAYKSLPAIAFMVESLHDLEEQLRQRQGRLYLFYGKAEEVIAQLTQQCPIDLVTYNRDYTPFARKRDARIQECLQQRSIDFYSAPDALLHEPEAIHKPNQKPYTIFTPFFRKASAFPVAHAQPNITEKYYTAPFPMDQGSPLLKRMHPSSTSSTIRGGTQAGRKLLHQAQSLVSYPQERDYPARAHTSSLSAHHKFGTLSIRETYHTLKRAPHAGAAALVRQLYWRDFFTHIAHHFPHVFEGCFHPPFDQIPWSNNPAYFHRWSTGTTGFPIVDAGMRELNATGYMHNRLRMITASFLVKDLHIDWRWGERYFAQRLVDYDPAVNNGNWQWVASTGCDAQPYFRIFNPWLQQKRFDADTRYIKKWIPELRPFTSAQIHQIPTQPLPPPYPSLIVDHKEAAHQAKLLYQIDQ